MMFAGLGVPSMCSTNLPPCSAAAIGAQCTPDDECAGRICVTGLPPCSSAGVGQQCTPDDQCDYVVAGSAMQCPDGSYPLPGEPCPNSNVAPGWAQKIIDQFKPPTVKVSATQTKKKIPWGGVFITALVVGGSVLAYRHYRSPRTA